jgi:hypothetical protein
MERYLAEAEAARQAEGGEEADEGIWIRIHPQEAFIAARRMGEE